jgi:CheY-like chemotaxis protein
MKTPRILIIDDERYVLEMIKISLEDQGFEVHLTSDASEGIRMAEELKPDLVLIDLIMEGIPGIEAVRRLKTGSGTRDLCVVVLSGKTLDSDRREAREAGADGFIGKPILPRRLIEEIRKYLPGGDNDD